MDRHPATTNPGTARYELRFHSLFQEGRGFAFPCNAAGDVDRQALSERERASLARAIAEVGREWSAPIVVPAAVPRLH
jgi:hypothetical protein